MLEKFEGVLKNGHTTCSTKTNKAKTHNTTQKMSNTDPITNLEIKNEQSIGHTAYSSKTSKTKIHKTEN